MGAFSRLLTLAAAAGGYAVYLHPRIVRWGATEEESAKALPGDGIVTLPRYRTTRAITIEAAPAEVWPWLVQMGQGRGGMYSYDWLENLFGCEIHSADRIHGEWQQLEVGDPIRLYPEGKGDVDVHLEVDRIDPERALVLRSPGRPEDSFAQDLPWISWAFVLEPLDVGRTRLLVRLRSEFKPDVKNTLFNQVALEPVHFVMEERMLRGIKARVEGVRRPKAVSAHAERAEPTMH